MVPWNEHVGIIFHVNCPEASLFTVVEFFYFQVHFPCKWELFFLNKQRNKLWNWQGKKVRVRTRWKLCYRVLYIFDLHRLSLRAIKRNLREINELLHKFFEEYCSGSYHLFFSCLSFLTTLEALKINVLPASSYNLRQQLFVEKLTDHLWVISWKLLYFVKG